MIKPRQPNDWFYENLKAPNGRTVHTYVGKRVWARVTLVKAEEKGQYQIGVGVPGGPPSQEACEWVLSQFTISEVLEGIGKLPGSDALIFRVKEEEVKRVH